LIPEERSTNTENEGELVTIRSREMHMLKGMISTTSGTNSVAIVIDLYSS